MLAVAVVAEAAMIANDVTRPVSVTWAPLIVLNLHPGGQLNLDHAVIKTVSQCCISERCPEDSRVSRVNRQLTVVAFILCIAVLAVRTVSVLFRLSVSREAKDAPGSTQLRCHDGTSISLVPIGDPAHTNTDGVPVSKRGKRLSVEGSMGGFLNMARAEAQSTRDTSPYLPSNTYEPQFSDIDATTAYCQETTTPGPRRGASSPLHRASSPAINDAQRYMLRAGYYSIAYFFGRFVVAVLAELSWPSAGFAPSGRMPRTAGRSRLLRSLYGQHPTLFLIVIAADEAVRDLWVLDHALRALNSESIRFTGLGGWITLDDIKTETKKVYEESREFPGSQVVILLTGHGGECNKMMLPMSKSIDATCLFELLFDPHDAHPAAPVTILFDICRPGVDPSPEPPEGISLIWTCFPGEVSGAYRLPHGPDSCFLTALMMASRQLAPNYTDGPPQDVVQIQLNHITEYLKELYIIKHSQGGCRWCLSGRRCFEPMPQNVDSKHAQNTDGLLMLMENLSGTTAADGVYRWFRDNPIFCTANNLPVPRGFRERLWGRIWQIVQAGRGGNPGSSVEKAMATGSDSRFDSLPGDNTSKHERGANKSVNAGQTLRRRVVTSWLVG
ncbi:unnamed protein product [Rhizoctonia solani]|uniref:Uncharacterized protein n=1 Tax=Rhizoctonia solani TaxID=456999 RepID=A0A8H3DNW8_9AGAM|nr:unnamed protein product [Rhizoctonia solani]